MKTIVLGFGLIVAAAVRCCGADGVAVFQAGLEAFQTNGPNALLGTWYSVADEGRKIAEIRADLEKTSRGLGPVVDTQVFAPRNLGKHVQRLYGVIYFERRPLWLRAEYYAIGGRSGFLSLEYSLNADDILPLVWATAEN